nr:uncharacterized protein LOC107447853 [Parasteatoda tepidariorum]
MITLQISEEIDVSVIEIKDPEKFILEGKRHIPVSSLRRILNAVLQHPDVGFMTMKRDHMDLVNDYKPYQYTICHYNDLDKSNYVSISPNGLVEFYNDDADFLPLDRFEVEYELYNKLKEMPSFQRYRLWKSFMVWLGKIRRRKFMIAKEKLEVFFIDKYKSVDK